MTGFINPAAEAGERLGLYLKVSEETGRKSEPRTRGLVQRTWPLLAWGHPTDCTHPEKYQTSDLSFYSIFYLFFCLSAIARRTGKLNRVYCHLYRSRHLCPPLCRGSNSYEVPKLLQKWTYFKACGLLGFICEDDMLACPRRRAI